MKRLIIAGGTGYIGSELINSLKDEYELVVLTRSPKKYKSSKGVTYILWDTKTLITDLLEGCYGVINLAGEDIGRAAWTSHQKDKIVDSRFQPAHYIRKSIEETVEKPKVWIQASATGFYGEWNGDKPLDEYAPQGEDSFLADVCEEWERPIRTLQDNSVRKVIIRTGIVISSRSQFMAHFLQSFRYKVAAIVGTGDDFIPWIHLTDEVAAIKRLLECEDCAGTYNLVAPNSVTIEDLIDEIKFYKRSLLTLKIPRCILEMIYGRTKTADLILINQKVLPKRLLADGFQFRYEQIRQAMKEVLIV